MATSTQLDWRHELLARFRSHWLLKGIGITAYVTAFMYAYFALLRHPQFPITVMPLGWLDHLVGFVPWAILPYASLWLYVTLVPGFLYLRGEMPRYVGAVTTVSLIGCGIFYFWPTTVPASTIDWSAWPAVALLKSTDMGGNACPSLHVAFSVLTLIWATSLLRRIHAPRVGHAINVVWCLLIVWSTMATRQHVALDVGAGALLGAAVAPVWLFAWPARARERRELAC